MAPNVPNEGSKAGHHMEKQSFAEGHLSPRLLCKTSRLSPSHFHDREIEETSTPPVFLGPSCISREAKNLAYW